jgi:HD superfamily phosphodiesterase
MNTNHPLTIWAAEQAKTFLSATGSRWLHVQGVVKQAQRISFILEEDEQPYLIAAAYLHDIGYAPALKQTGFHPLDGAQYLYACGHNRLAALVAYHSGARFEAALQGYGAALSRFPREETAVADALTYCDMTTSPTGERVTFETRISEIFERHGENSPVAEAIRQALPLLSLAVWRTQHYLIYDYQQFRLNETKYA